MYCRVLRCFVFVSLFLLLSFLCSLAKTLFTRDFTMPVPATKNQYRLTTIFSKIYQVRGQITYMAVKAVELVDKRYAVRYMFHVFRLHICLGNALSTCESPALLLRSHPNYYIRDSIDRKKMTCNHIFHVQNHTGCRQALENLHQILFRGSKLCACYCFSFLCVPGGYYTEPNKLPRAENLVYTL